MLTNDDKGALRVQEKLKSSLAWLCMLAALFCLAVPLVQVLAPPAPEEFQSVHAADTLPPLYGLSPDSFLNTADAAALDTLPGVGEVIAQRIIDMRDELGGFRLAEELLLVRGIGEKVLQGILDALDEPLVALEAVGSPQEIVIN